MHDLFKAFLEKSEPNLDKEEFIKFAQTKSISREAVFDFYIAKKIEERSTQGASVREEDASSREGIAVAESERLLKIELSSQAFKDKRLDSDTDLSVINNLISQYKDSIDNSHKINILFKLIEIPKTVPLSHFITCVENFEIKHLTEVHTTKMSLLFEAFIAKSDQTLDKNQFEGLAVKFLDNDSVSFII